MPQPESTKKGDVEYIVRGSGPVFTALVVATFVLLIVALAMQYVELTKFYDYPVGIFF